MRVAVLGAGMVGVSCALALQSRGLQVTLIDRRPPGSETSHGNAGVLSPTSLIPFNNPGLWSQLPGLLQGRQPGFRYSRRYLLQEWRWAGRFMAHARLAPFEYTVAALHELISLSRGVHQQWLDAAGLRHRLREQGWIFLYRSEAAWQAAAWAREIYTRHGVVFESLDPGPLSDLEPALQPVFAKGVWFPQAGSVDDPAEIVRAYARLFVARGGQWRQFEVQGLQRSSDSGWRVLDGASETGLACDQVVLALGPFARQFMERQGGMRVPMAFERGSHMHYAPGPQPLSRPVYDTAGGYVLSPMAGGWRLTTGVELNDSQAPSNTAMLDVAETRARQALQLGPRLDAQAWLGSRPTLPDSRPMIGACPGQPGMWLATGHQHIGFSTGPATGQLLADLMLGQRPGIDMQPFNPARFA